MGKRKRKSPIQRKRELRLIADDEPRLYTKDQLRFAGFKKVLKEETPSVTTKLRAKNKGIAFEVWLANQKSYATAIRHRNKRADIGLETHKQIARALNGQRVRLRPGTKLLFRTAKQFIEKLHLKPVAVEKIVYCPDENYAGTLDLVAKIGKKRVIIDWKTTKGRHPLEHKPQIAAYWNAYDRRISEAWIVYLGKRGYSMICMGVAELEAAYEAFTHIGKVWEWDNASYMKRNGKSNGKMESIKTIIARRTRQIRKMTK